MAKDKTPRAKASAKKTGMSSPKKSVGKKKATASSTEKPAEPRKPKRSEIRRQGADVDKLALAKEGKAEAPVQEVEAPVEQIPVVDPAVSFG
jgi:hypothetical protein